MRIRRKKTILEQAADYVESALEKAGPALADARDRAAPILADAKVRAGSAMEQAGPTLVDARDKATPLIAQSAALAAEKAALAADIAAQKAARGRDLAAAKAAELSAPQKKKHPIRRLLVFTGIAALLGFAVNRMRSAADEEDWESSYTPTPPPPPPARPATQTPIADAAAASTATEGADEGGAGPDEALADAVEEQHEVTTPDEPADIVDVDAGEKPPAKK